MRQRGRKDKFAVLHPGKQVERPSAPKGMPAPAKRVWERITGAMPPDWFRPEHIDMLEQYCLHIAAARKYARRRDRQPVATDEDVLTANRLSTMADRETKVALALARSMRITHQAQMRAETAARKADNQRSADHLWNG